MITIADVKWGHYRNLEGPLTRGPASGAYVIPPNPTDADRAVAVTTAAEGGYYGAVNMYDRGIVSLGLLQFIEGLGQFSVSALLGAVARTDPGLLKPVEDLTQHIGVDFMDVSTTSTPKWRFRYRGTREIVDTTPEQQHLFYLQSTGERGTWNAESQAHAKSWAVALANIWEDPRAQQIQSDFTARSLMGFASSSAKMLLDEAPATPVGGAFKSAYLSFAVNNPRWASDALKAALEGQGRLATWSQAWLEHVLQYLVFHEGISIYPARYKAIRPVLEQLYELDLPDFATDLKKFEQEADHDLWAPSEIQQALITLGYDLGPTGADGKWGKKSQEAFLLFEQQYGLEAPDGKPDHAGLQMLTTAVNERKS